jgi:diadenosine tetraphosphate (Ap4A) HIT family hydrolase
MADFALHPQLAGDTFAVAALPLSDLRLMNQARFPWMVLIPRRADAVEIIDLAKPDRALLFEEITAVSSALRAATGCYKLNVAALGNQVRQLHVHIIARFENDAAWPRPVWGAADTLAYEPGARDRMIAGIRSNLPV